MRVQKRSYAIGNRVAWVSGILAAIAAGADALLGDFALGMAEGLMTLGCAVSIIWTRQSGRKDYFAWLPLYVAVWIAYFPIVLMTGGFYGPLVGPCLVIIFLLGILVQSRFSVTQIWAITVSAVIPTLIAQIFLNIPAPRGMILGMCVLKVTLTLILVFVFVREFVNAEERFFDEAAAVNQNLIETREHLTHSARMAEIGNRLATTVHELSQPFQVLMNSVTILKQLLSRDSPPLELAHSTLDRLERSLSHMSRLLERLRQFSRKDTIEKQRFDLREAVTFVEKLVDYDLRVNQVAFRVQLPHAPAYIEGDLLRVQQIILNLINNARDASLTSFNPQVGISVTQTQTSVRMIVQNSGRAIPLEVQSRLFQPYFTTKSKNLGTGLGLAICEQLVNEQGGRVLFSSEDENTVFVVDLPHAPSE